jgi:actin-like ATPase involved in cell morphogenesis
VGYVLAVDLGTTYTAAAIAEDGHAEIVQLGTQSVGIPSVVVLRGDGMILTGEVAERRALAEPQRTAREFKRRLGDPTPLLLGTTPFGVEALLGRLLHAVIEYVTEVRGEPPGTIVVTHPASYGPYKLDLMRQAIAIAGAADALLLPEPEAAAIYYSSQQRLEPGSLIAVYDFGGGTFDVALLQKSSDGFELLGEPEGLERLGGIDFDEAIFQQVLRLAGGLPRNTDEESENTLRMSLARLREDARVAKEHLSEDSEALIVVSLPDRHQEIRLTREEFEETVQPRLEETVRALERCVHSAGKTIEQLDQILLVGGTSRIPLVSAYIHETTGRPTAIDAHPKHAIALGAAIYGSIQPAAGSAVDPSVSVVLSQSEQVPLSPPARGNGVGGARGRTHGRSGRYLGLLAVAAAVVLIVTIAFVAASPGGDSSEAALAVDSIHNTPTALSTATSTVVPSSPTGAGALLPSVTPPPGSASMLFSGAEASVRNAPQCQLVLRALPSDSAGDGNRDIRRLCDGDRVIVVTNTPPGSTVVLTEGYVWWRVLVPTSGDVGWIKEITIDGTGKRFLTVSGQ